MKRGLALILTLALAIFMSGCAEKLPLVNTGTPAGDAHDLIQKQGKKISGFSRGGVGFDYRYDMLELYAVPDMDWAALFETMETALDGREISAVSLNQYDFGRNGVESLLEAFSLNVSSPVKRLELAAPSMSANAVAQPALWRESLERLDFVEELKITADGSFNYLLDIADDGTIRAPFDAVVVAGNAVGSTDVSGLRAFSGLKRLVLEESANVSGIESLDPSETQIDLSLLSGNLNAAELAYKLRPLGFTLAGISEDPRADLSAEDAQKYDAYVAVRETMAALTSEDMPFPERLERFREVVPGATREEEINASIRLLQEFYALAGTDEFPEYAGQMCSFDEWTEQRLSYTNDQRYQFVKNLHQYLLTKLCVYLSDQDFERFLTEVVDHLPEAGNWCKAKISVTEKDGEPEETNALRALTRGYGWLSPAGNNPTMSKEQYEELLNHIGERDLLWGTYNSRYFTGDPEQDVATAARLIDAGRVEYREAYSMMVPNGDDPDAFLKATTVWDAAFDGTFADQWASVNALTIDDERFDKSRFERPDSPIFATGTDLRQRKALIAYETRDSDELIFPADAYRWFVGEDGERFRGVLAANTPASVDEAEVLIIAWLKDYVYAGDYSDGTKGYRLISDLWAYDIETGECLERIDSITTDPAEHLAAGGEKYDVYPDVSLLTLFRRTSSWFGNDNGFY